MTIFGKVNSTGDVHPDCGFQFCQVASVKDFGGNAQTFGFLRGLAFLLKGVFRFA